MNSEYDQPVNIGNPGEFPLGDVCDGSNTLCSWMIFLISSHLFSQLSDEYTIKNFATKIRDMCGSKSEIKYLPKVADDPTQRKADISRAKKELDWEPKVTVEEGLKKTIEYFKGEVEAAGEIVPTGPDAAKPKGSS